MPQRLMPQAVSALSPFPSRPSPVQPMDDYPRPLSLNPLQSRKRKADSDDRDNADPATSSQLQLQLPDSVQPLAAAHPSKLLDPPSANRNRTNSIDLGVPTPRLSLETAATACTASGDYTTGLPTENSPLPSPSVPPCPPSPQADSPSRAKRPRIEAVSSSLPSSRGNSPSSHRAPTLHPSRPTSWQWARTPSGTRLTAQVPPQSRAHLPLAKGPPNAVPRLVIPIDPSSPHIPIRTPPINKETLKELDLDAIMRNPQLRAFLSTRPRVLLRKLISLFVRTQPPIPVQATTSSSTPASNSAPPPPVANVIKPKPTGSPSSTNSPQTAPASPSTSPVVLTAPSAFVRGYHYRSHRRIR